jgi:hypothetical protein
MPNTFTDWTRGSETVSRFGIGAGAFLARAATALLALAPAAAVAATPVPWTSNDISVSRTVPGQPTSASTHFEVGEKGDARIAVDLRDGSTHTRGTILLIGGRWMLTQGFPGAGSKEIDALDTAVLNSQLVLVLLTDALPDGPPAPGAPQHVRFAEKNKPIKIATPSRSVEYLAPWTVAGSVSVPVAQAPASYQLSFTYSEEGVARTLDFTGSVGSLKSPLDLPDSMKLAGWRIARLPAATETAPADSRPGTAVNQPAPKAATLGALRALD